jgi:hypothetical protein
MTVLFLVCLLVVGILVAVFRPGWADFCVRVAGVMAVGYVILQVFKILLAH